MRRKIFLSVLVLLFFTSMYAISSAQNLNLTKLILQKGTVLYKLPEGKDFQRVTGGAIFLPEGSVIQTMEDSSAKVTFPDESSMLMGENTILKIITQKTDDKEENFALKLIGRIYINVTKAIKKKEYQIETPTALATIRGTKANIIVEKNLFTKIAVIEGTVDTSATYLTKGMAQQLFAKYLIMETKEGLQKINIGPDTIIATRLPKKEINPVAKFSLNAGLPLNNQFISLNDNKKIDYKINVKDNLAVYGKLISKEEINASIILFAGKDLSENTFTPQDFYTFVETPFVEIIPTQPIVTVTTGCGTTIGPAAPPQPPAPAPIFVPTPGAEAPTGGTPPGPAPGTGGGTTPTSGGTTAPVTPGNPPPIYNPSSTGNWQIIIQ